MVSQTNGFCTVAHADVFSHVHFLRASYTSNHADADGRCHSANYWAVTQILLPDVDRANPITMVGPSTLRTPKHTPLDLAAHIEAMRASPARVVLVLQRNIHTQPFCLVGELVADRAMRPLMDFLVVGVSNIVVLPDIAYIAYHNRLHAICVERGDQSGCALVLDIFDLMFDSRWRA